MKAREVVRAIERAGGKKTRQTGSHARYAVPYTKPDGTPSTAYGTVPVHGGDIPQGTLDSIERQLEPALGKEWLQG
ncbi:type II toxin-antitoxin system HicA family toxin [Kribbella sp. NBC_00359]|uniref:type II toxin-antitoxin system HicA family toxin n=1 Tax=Kribbella sp. NBC_00359 TaxID=2975966 RepID=UPI002E207701